MHGPIKERVVTDLEQVETWVDKYSAIRVWRSRASERVGKGDCMHSWNKCKKLGKCGEGIDDPARMGWWGSGEHRWGRQARASWRGPWVPSQEFRAQYSRWPPTCGGLEQSDKWCAVWVWVTFWSCFCGVCCCWAPCIFPGGQRCCMLLFYCLGEVSETWGGRSYHGKRWQLKCPMEATPPDLALQVFLSKCLCFWLLWTGRC